MISDNSFFERFCDQSEETRLEKVSEQYYLKPFRPRKNVEGLVIGVSPTAHEIICRNFGPDINFIAGEATNLGLPVIGPATSNKWGFGETFQTIKLDKGWYEYQLLVDQNYGAISAGLDIVFDFLKYLLDEESPSEIEQLCIIDEIGRGSGQSSKGVVAKISPVVRKWLAETDQQQLSIFVQTSMREMYNRLNRKYPKRDLYHFKASFNEDRFSIAAPGSDCHCFFVPGDTIPSRDRVSSVSPHNMDTFCDQFTILAGFAEIWEQCRQVQLINPDNQ